MAAVRGTFGIPLGMCGVLDGCQAYYFGSQGWEFLELDRIWQDLLLAGVGLWVLVLFRGIQNFLTWESMRSTPAWLLYGCSAMVFFRSLLPLVSPASVILTEQLSLRGLLLSISVSKEKALVFFIFIGGNAHGTMFGV